MWGPFERLYDKGTTFAIRSQSDFDLCITISCVLCFSLQKGRNKICCNNMFANYLEYIFIHIMFCCIKGVQTGRCVWYLLTSYTKGRYISGSVVLRIVYGKYLINILCGTEPSIAMPVNH